MSTGGPGPYQVPVVRTREGKERKERQDGIQGKAVNYLELSMIWTKRFVYLLLVMLSLITGFRQLNTAKRRFDLMKRYVAKGKTLVIVESPAKAKTIQKLIDNDKYIIDFCKGHIRDLLKKESVIQSPSAINKHIILQELNLKVKDFGVDVFNNFEPIYAPLRDKQEIYERLKREAAKCSEILLATDEDREGEAISWHLVEMLKPKVPFKRAVFHEITKDAILQAFQNPREIDMQLVQSQETRRIIDRLTGYTITPIIWRYIAPGLSAGRVQSCGLYLIAQRERKRWDFVVSKYFSIMTSLYNPAKKADVMLGKLVSYNGVTVAGDKDFDGKTGEIKDLSLLLLDSSKAHDIMKWLVSSQVAYTVSNIETRKINRSPPPPFITSTLQQEASKKLGLSPSRTMSIAQELYEQGYITYMRTDSPYLSSSAVNMAKSYVLNNKGSTYLADDTKPKSAKSAPPKNAQEAHEAIRPADSNGRFRTPQDTGLDGQQLSLYTLIYKRTIASVMAASISETKTYTIQASGDGNQALIRSSATSVLFDGYLNIYGVEAMTPQDTASALKVKDPLLLSPKFTRDNSRDDSEEEATDGEENSEKVVMKGVQGMAHTTRAPSRFTEASFIKELDDIGVGRPSTYSKILNILKERGYIMVDKQTIIPTLTGMVVSSFLEKHFNDLVEPQFTASMEDSLDAIAHGTKDKLDILTHFYLNDNPSTKSGLLYRVQNKIQNQLIDQKSSRILDIPFLKDVGRIQINRSGAYVESVDATESGDDAKQYRWKLSDEMNNDIRVITEDSIKELMATRSSMQGNSLGTHPSSNKQMVIRSGRYGTYLQVGEDADKDKSTHSLPDWLDAASCTIHDALQFASLPLTIGNHPDLNEPIVVEVGSRKLCVSMPTYSARYPLPDHTYISDVTVEVALQYLPSTEEIMRSQRLLGEDKNCSDAKVWLKLGRFGYYVRRENTIAGIGARVVKKLNKEPFDITMEDAILLLNTVGKQMGKKTAKAKKVATKKAKVEVDGPKKLNAYQVYVKELTSSGKTLKEAAGTWKTLSESDKKVYQQRAAATTPVTGEKSTATTKKTKSTKVKVAADGPKKLSGYQVYVKELTSSGKTLKEAAGTWKTLSDSSKAAYQQRAAATTPVTGEKSTATTKKTKSTEPSVAADGPKKLNAYQVYVKELTSSGKTLKEAAGTWKTLSESDKAVYQQRAARASDASV